MGVDSLQLMWCWVSTCMGVNALECRCMHNVISIYITLDISIPDGGMT